MCDVCEGGRVNCVCVCGLFYFAPAQVFDPVLKGVRKKISSYSVMDDKVMEAYFALSELCDVKEGGSNFRPLCQMVRLAPTLDHNRVYCKRFTHIIVKLFVFVQIELVLLCWLICIMAASYLYLGCIITNFP